MLEFTTKPDPTAKPPEREELFSIDGKAYTIPKTIRPLLMARYAHLVDTMGSDSAGLWALREALGDEGYFALINLPPERVSKDDLATVMAVVTGRFIGLATEVPSADPKSAPVETASPDELGAEPPDSEVWPDATPAATGS
jgi:hypothetical protein